MCPNFSKTALAPHIVGTYMNIPDMTYHEYVIPCSYTILLVFMFFVVDGML